MKKKIENPLRKDKFIDYFLDIRVTIDIDINDSLRKWYKPIEKEIYQLVIGVNNRVHVTRGFELIVLDQDLFDLLEYMGVSV